jgi:hypothetical protein
LFEKGSKESGNLTPIYGNIRIFHKLLYRGKEEVEGTEEGVRCKQRVRGCPFKFEIKANSSF